MYDDDEDSCLEKQTHDYFPLFLIGRSSYFANDFLRLFFSEKFSS